MMIFDSFPTREQAEQFAKAARKIPGFTEGFQREAFIADNQDESDEMDPFPFELDGFIVHVSRDMTFDAPDFSEKGYPGEEELKTLVAKYGGFFAGT